MTLRARLLAGFTVIFFVVVVAGVFTVLSQRGQLIDQVDDRLVATPLPPETRARPGTAAVVPPGRPAATPLPSGGQRVDDQSISDLYVAVIDNGELRPTIVGTLLVDTPDLQYLVDDPPAVRTLESVSGVDDRSTFRLVFLPGSAAVLDTVVAVPIDSIDETIRQLLLTFLVAVVVILLALVLIASWVNRFGLRPLNEMTLVAEAISDGERDRRAGVTDQVTEAGRLGHAFNVMLDERDDSEARLRQFVSNASHELRTPLTSIRGYVDLYRAGGFRKPGELDDAMRRVHFEAERMNHLVDGLLVLAKFDEEQPLDLAMVDLDALVLDVVGLALAAHPHRRIDAGPPQRVEISADHFRLHQALAALVDNAVCHTPDDASIEVAARDRGDVIELTVTDTGPGLSATEAAAVFDRFSRGDPSRARSTGGSGLGLSIAQSIVHAHGGEISVTATPGQGATFRIVLPASG